MSTPTRTGRVAVNGVELYYEVHGKGAPLVMLHGGVNPSDMFGAPLAAMAESHEVIAIHMRGHGFSTDTKEPWSYEQMADDVAALVRKLGIRKIDFMGWSLGAGIALQRSPEPGICTQSICPPSQICVTANHSMRSPPSGNFSDSPNSS